MQGVMEDIALQNAILIPNWAWAVVGTSFLVCSWVIGWQFTRMVGGFTETLRQITKTLNSHGAQIAVFDEDRVTNFKMHSTLMETRDRVIVLETKIGQEHE